MKQGDVEGLWEHLHWLTVLHQQGSSLPLWLVVQAFLGAYYGIALATLQLITPNRMRGLNAALFPFASHWLDWGQGALSLER